MQQVLVYLMEKSKDANSIHSPAIERELDAIRRNSETELSYMELLGGWYEVYLEQYGERFARVDCYVRDNITLRKDIN